MGSRLLSLHSDKIRNEAAANTNTKNNASKGAANTNTKNSASKGAKTKSCANTSKSNQAAEKGKDKGKDPYDKICTYFAKGHCQRGKTCLYIHSPHDSNERY